MPSSISTCFTWLFHVRASRVGFSNTLRNLHALKLVCSEAAKYLYSWHRGNILRVSTETIQRIRCLQSTDLCKPQSRMEHQTTNPRISRKKRALHHVLTYPYERCTGFQKVSSTQHLPATWSLKRSDSVLHLLHAKLVQWDAEPAR